MDCVIVAAVAGLFWSSGDTPATYSSIQGEDICRYDSDFKEAVNGAPGIVALLIVIPLLVAMPAGYCRGSIRTALVFRSIPLQDWHLDPCSRCPSVFRACSC